MAIPTYDDLVFLIAFLWKWSDEPPVFEALIHDDDDIDDVSRTIDDLLEQWPYSEALKREDFERARRTFWALKDQLVKINGFWG